MTTSKSWVKLLMIERKNTLASCVSCLAHYLTVVLVQHVVAAPVDTSVAVRNAAAALGATPHHLNIGCCTRVSSARRLRNPFLFHPVTSASYVLCQDVVVVAAETGGGKTLAFLLPVVEQLSRNLLPLSEMRLPIALVLTTSQELAKHRTQRKKPREFRGDDVATKHTQTIFSAATIPDYGKRSVRHYIDYKFSSAGFAITKGFHRTLPEVDISYLQNLLKSLQERAIVSWTSSMLAVNFSTIF
ncbi:unnamed protein product [Peronospora belbahrii]|uniref:DEAD/DEAH-box helicase domain-containing protein n=1 Tax=Peronospora belbahrii TaxID=622444 RepID=A0ABN8D0A2_9STRA|nr:unnamed protein product [Peronospora belbahrii]